MKGKNLWAYLVFQLGAENQIANEGTISHCYSESCYSES